MRHLSLMILTEQVIAFALGLQMVSLASVNTCLGDEQLEFFETRIRPILIEHCYECHSSEGKAIKGGLQLDSRQGLLTGGDSGPAVLPGDAANSLLLQALRHESFEMPPDRKLPAAVIQSFEHWINSGATDPRDGQPVQKKQSVNLEQARAFWSFQPVRQPVPPSIHPEWGRSEIDDYIAAQQAAQGFSVSETASPDVMARRLHVVLTGLPPSTTDLIEFRKQWALSPDAAIEQTTDTLLASHHFGERWGRHWLDVTRFAESSGGGRSLMFPHAWRFRDYVVHSFNQDKPLNQFVMEQIAGDLLPSSSDAQHDEQIIGSGYLILGAINYEEQDKEALRMDVVDEQIEAIGRTFLGMTLGCARCHDHKFDPIPTEDYYGMAGILRSTKVLTPGNVSGYVTTPLRTGFDPAVMTNWKTRHDELSAQIRDIQSRLGTRKNSGPVALNELHGIVIDDSEATLTGQWIPSVFVKTYAGAGYQHSGQPRTGELARFEAPVKSDGIYSVRIAYNAEASRSPKVPIRVTHRDGTSDYSLNQQQPPVIDGLWTEIGSFPFSTSAPAIIEVLASEADRGYVIIDAVQLLPVSSNESDTKQFSGSTITTAEDLAAQEKRLTAELKAWEKQKPEIPVAMSVQEDANPSDWHVHIRGGIRNLGPVVPRNVLKVTLPPDQPVIPIAAGQSGRKELATWVASENNPLTARVYVNRVWNHVIGEGLVRTPDNFGTTGQMPTHPELLDWLAWHFMHTDGWSTKKLIRRIVTSGTFRLSSEPLPANEVRDPENIYLTHAFRRRVEAEVIRDAILSVSGELDLSIRGGLTIGKLTEYDNVYDHSMYPTNARSVYVPFFRNAMLNIFDVFDIANPNTVTGKRTANTLPAQSLYLMNSGFIARQADLAASRHLSTTATDESHLVQSVHDAWQKTLGRDATPEELKRTLDHLKEHGSNNPEAWADVFHALFGSIDFRFME